MLEGLLDSMRWEMTFSEMGSFWDGFFVTLQVVIAGLALSLILGTLLGVFSTTRSRVLRAISRIYVEFYQNTPLPVQVFFMYMAGPQLLQAITGAASPVRISSFALGFLGVGLYHAAYVSEVIRTGIESVPRGQMEAALSQGFSRVQAYRYVILPQTLKIIIPALFSQCTTVIKDSSYLAGINVAEFMYSTKVVMAQTSDLSQVLALYGFTFALYFVLNFGISLIVRAYQRRVVAA